MNFAKLKFQKKNSDFYMLNMEEEQALGQETSQITRVTDFKLG